jgi:transmembrane sensor
MTKMDENNIHIDFEALAGKYLASSASSEEAGRLEALVRSDEEKCRLFFEMKKNWMMAATAGQKFDKSTAWEEIASQTGLETSAGKIKPLRPQPSKSLNRFWKVAAVVLLLIAGTWSVYYFSQVREKIFIAYDRAHELKLHDGSLRTLKAGSELTYPGRFRAAERRVKLTGEAFFEVAKLQEKPFVVEAQSAEIRVLGTSFYVNAIRDALEVEVVVSTGKVALTAPDSRQLQLTAGQKGIYSKSDGMLQEGIVENTNFLAWKTRLLIFEDTGLQEVFEILGQTYGERFNIAEELESCRLTATFREKSLEDVLAIIRETFGLRYIKSDGVIQVSGHACD